MKRFEFTQNYESHKKGEVIEFDEKEYHGFQHPLLMRGILRNTETEKLLKSKQRKVK